MDDEPTSDLLAAVTEAERAPDLLGRLRWLRLAQVRLRKEVADTERAALAVHSVTEVAMAGGVSHQYVSRLARRIKLEGSKTDDQCV